MTDLKKKPGVAFWATVGVVCLPLIYMLSFGPACWWCSRSAALEGRKPRDTVYYPVFDRVYYPILLIWCEGPRPVAHAIDRYGNLNVASRFNLHVTRYATGRAGGSPSLIHTVDVQSKFR